MPISICPACRRRRARTHYLCPVCWYALTPDTRRQLLRRDAGAIRRLRQLYEQIGAGTPLADIHIHVDTAEEGP